LRKQVAAQVVVTHLGLVTGSSKAFITLWVLDGWCGFDFRQLIVEAFLRLNEYGSLFIMADLNTVLKALRPNTPQSALAECVLPSPLASLK
jgi:hypothetical protein